MSKRTFFITSIALALIALVLHSVASDKLERGSHLKAKQLEIAVTQQTHYTADPEADRLFRSGHILSRIGMAFTISSAACVFVAIARRESGWYSVPLLLLFFDFAVQFLL
jgi:hypothetical protein